MRSNNNQKTHELIGVGLYELAEAAAITGIPANSLKRWLFGYKAQSKQYDGIWTPSVSEKIPNILSFHDLLEVRFVDAFRQHGVSLQAIREASNYAREQFNNDFPFTCRQFQTDGKSIFAVVQEKTGDDSLLDLVKRQQVFKSVVSPSLYQGIEYFDDETAARWFPVKNSEAIVIDPARNFGKPMLNASGLDVETVVQAWKAEGEDKKRVARLYELPVNAVEEALNYHLSLVAS